MCVNANTRTHLAATASASAARLKQPQGHHLLARSSSRPWSEGLARSDCSAMSYSWGLPYSGCEGHRRRAGLEEVPCMVQSIGAGVCAGVKGGIRPASTRGQREERHHAPKQAHLRRGDSVGRWSTRRGSCRTCGGVCAEGQGGQL